MKNDFLMKKKIVEFHGLERKIVLRDIYGYLFNEVLQNIAQVTIQLVSKRRMQFLQLSPATYFP